jgi:twinkle protein
MEIYMGKAFKTSAGLGATAEDIADALLFIDGHFRFIYPEETDFHIDYLIELAKTAWSEWNFDGFVIDPYNELEHKRPGGMSETEYISQLLSKLRRFTRSQMIHTWFVAHPTKLKEMQTIEIDGRHRKIYAMPSLYDISGGAHWRNKADNGLVIHRDFTKPGGPTTVSVQKVRFRECGEPGEVEMFYDKFSNRLTEYEHH